MDNLKNVFTLLRPVHWIKNIFVFAPLFFTDLFFESSLLLVTGIAFIYFCLASSFVYVLNDLGDIEEDKFHPIKSTQRPLASGKVSLSTAKIVLAILFLFLISSFYSIPNLLIPLSGYIALNVFYTFFLKKIVIVDVFCIALGFVLRIYAGAEAAEIDLSEWMLVTTLNLALFIGFIKRKQDLISGDEQSRESLNHYNSDLINSFSLISAAACLVFYSLYVIETDPNLVSSVPLVIYGIFRFWYINESLYKGVEPMNTIFKDVQLQICLVIWVIFVIFLRSI